MLVQGWGGAADHMQDQRPYEAWLGQALDARRSAAKNPAIRASTRLGGSGGYCWGPNHESTRRLCGRASPPNVSHTQNRCQFVHANPCSLAQRTSEGVGEPARVPLYATAPGAGGLCRRLALPRPTSKARQELWDTLQQTATAYFSLLRAKSVGKAYGRQTVEKKTTRQNIGKLAWHVRPSGLSNANPTFWRWVGHKLRTSRSGTWAHRRSEVRAGPRWELGRIIHEIIASL